jgi:hypothetical protein
MELSGHVRHFFLLGFLPSQCNIAPADMCASCLALRNCNCNARANDQEQDTLRETQWFLMRFTHANLRDQLGCHSRCLQSYIRTSIGKKLLASTPLRIAVPCFHRPRITTTDSMVLLCNMSFCQLLTCGEKVMLSLFVRVHPSDLINL